MFIISIALLLIFFAFFVLTYFTIRTYLKKEIIKHKIVPGYAFPLFYRGGILFFVVSLIFLIISFYV